MSKLKDLRVILAIMLFLSWVGASVGGYFYHTAKTKEIEKRDVDIASLQESINQVGELITAYTVVADVKTGKKIEETDLQPIEVPLSMATNLVQDPAELIGKYYKLDLTAGTAITNDVIYTEELTDDMRLFDVVLHNMPVGLKPGAFIDVRISLPLGEDFIAIPHKKVHDINAGVIKLAVKEEDIHVYNSMLIDSLIYPGTQLYAVEYLEGGVQAPANSYYPISKNILAVAQKDPNLISAIKSDIIQRRTHLETGLEAIQPTEGQREEIDRVLERGKEKYRETFVEAEREYQRRMEKEEELRREQEAQAAANGG